MGNPFFHFKQFSILQQEKGLKLTTDACLLGSIASHPNPGRCLDIGTGSGILALFLAQRFPKSVIDALEIDEVVSQQAENNIKTSSFSNRIQLIHIDFLKFVAKNKYHLIICNPPYFNNHIQKPASSKNRAIHNIDLPFTELQTRVAGLLEKDGCFWIILPPYEAENFISSAAKAELYCKEEIKVFNRPEKHFRSILCFKNVFDPDLLTRELLIEDKSGKKTEAFRLLMEDFYLENTEKYKSRQ